MALARFARGEIEEADAALQALLTSPAEGRPTRIAIVYALRSAADHMFEWLNRAYAQREAMLVSTLGWHSLFVRYYSDPCFIELCKKKIGVTLPK